MRAALRQLASVVLASPLAALLACAGDAQPSSSWSSGGGGASASSSADTSSTGVTTGTGSGGDAEWTIADWAVPGCLVEYAKRPEHAFPAIEWEGCPGEVAGCERIKKNWPHEGVFGMGDPVVQPRGGGYEIGFFVSLEGLVPRVVYFDPAGVPMAAYKHGPETTCLFAAVGLSVDGHWIGSQRIGVDPPSRFAFQPRSAPLGQVELVPFDRLAQFQRGGDELLALQLDFGVGWFIYDRVTGLVHAAPSDFTSTKPTLSGGHAFMLRFDPDLDSPQAWAFSRQSGSFARLIHGDPGYVVRVHGDGNDLVWIEGSGPPWPAAGTLKRSPFTASAAGVQPTVVRPMPSLAPTGSGVVGEGFYALGFDADHLFVVRLADGRLWKLPLPPSGDGAYLNHIAHVDANYVFYKTSTHVYRQRLDQLGPGFAANELPP